MRLFRRRRSEDYEYEDGESGDEFELEPEQAYHGFPPGEYRERAPGATAGDDDDALPLDEEPGYEGEEASADETAEAPPPQDLMSQLAAEAASEMEAQEAAAAASEGAEEDELDPGLLDIFRDARNEVEEGTLASELDDVPIMDLLGDIVGVSYRLGIPLSAGRYEPCKGNHEGPGACLSCGHPAQPPAAVKTVPAVAETAQSAAFDQA